MHFVRRFFPVLLCTCVCVAGARAGEELPQPPPGYAWGECSEFAAALLVPAGWHFLSTVSNNTPACFITRDRIDENGRFLTGITVNAFTDMRSRSGMSAYEYARKFVRELAAKTSLEDTWQSETGPYVSMGAVFRVAGNGPGVRYYNLLVANEDTGTLYVVVFEAPMSRWAREWSIAEPVLQSLMLDDEY